MNDFTSQDHMAWETQGPLADRAAEHLGESDRGILMFRKLLHDQIRAVESGADPIGLNMDPKNEDVIKLIPEGYTAFQAAMEM
jgi:5,5'-dehydrodivanillate O-demethylase